MGVRRLALGVIGLAGLLGVTTYAGGSAASTSGLVLNYTFAGETGTTVTDRSPSGLNATLVNTSAPSAYVTSLSGHDQALKLVGASHQWVNVGDAPPLDVAKYTVAAWVRYTGVQNDKTLGRWEILEKPDAYWMNIRTSGVVRAGGFYGGCADANWKYLDTPQPIPVNTWTHVASRYNASQLSIWVNGTKVASRAVTGTTCSNNQPLAVGAKNQPAKGLLEAFFDGNLDDVRVYNRVLTATEIAALAAR